MIIKNNKLNKTKTALCGIIYGEAGTGKTSLGVSARGNTLVIDLFHEKGYEYLTDDTTFDVLEVNDLKVLDDLIKAPAKYLKGYDSVIFDNMSKIKSMMEAPMQIGASKSFDFWGTLADRQLKVVTNLRQHGKISGTDVFFLCHQRKIEEVVIDDTIVAPSIVPDLRDSVYNLILGDMDLIIHTQIVGETDYKEVEGVDIQVRSTKFVLHLAPHSLYITKARGLCDAPTQIVMNKKRSLDNILNRLYKIKK